MTHPGHRLYLLSAFYVLSVGLAFGEPAAERPPQPEPGTQVAQVGGTAIPYSTLQSVTQDKLAQLQHQYDMQFQQLALGTARAKEDYLETELQNLVNKRALKLEASARKTTDTALLSAVKAAAISDADVLAFYDSQKSQIGQPFDAASPQIRQFLQRQAEEEAQLQYFQTLRTKYKVETSWEPMREQVEANGPQRGSADAVVTIVEFSDFQCPFCGRLAPVLKQVLKAYPSQVRVIFRNLPLRAIHPDAEKAAEAGVCAKLQGKFWEMHDVMYSEQNSLSVDALKEKARRLNLDSKQFEECLNSGQGLAAVKADEDAAFKLGLAATPSSFINGRFVNGAEPFHQWKALIDDEMRRTARNNPRNPPLSGKRMTSD
jgi:protein-disulfide isomerase